MLDHATVNGRISAPYLIGIWQDIKFIISMGASVGLSLSDPWRVS